MSGAPTLQAPHGATQEQAGFNPIALLQVFLLNTLQRIVICKEGSSSIHLLVKGCFTQVYMTKNI